MTSAALLVANRLSASLTLEPPNKPAAVDAKTDAAANKRPQLIPVTSFHELSQCKYLPLAGGLTIFACSNPNSDRSLTVSGRWTIGPAATT